MPECTNCGKQWSWKETLKSSFSLDPAMRCPYCGNKQYVTLKSRKRMLILNLLIPLPVLLPLFTDFSLALILGIMLAIFASNIAIMPRLTELADEEEHSY